LHTVSCSDLATLKVMSARKPGRFQRREGRNETDGSHRMEGSHVRKNALSPHEALGGND